MLKTRVIPTLLFKDHGLVKGKKFNSNRGVGSVIPAVKIYNLREVDELIFLDVDITNSNKNLNLDIVFNEKRLNGVKRKITDCSIAKSYGWKHLYSLDEGFDLTLKDFLKKK